MTRGWLSTFAAHHPTPWNVARVAVPASEGCPHVPKRLRLTRNRCRLSQANAMVAVSASLSGALEHVPLTKPDSIVPPTASPIPNRVEADRPVLRPSRRLVLVMVNTSKPALSRHHLFPLGGTRQITRTRLMLSNTPQRAQSGWAEVEQDFNHFDTLVADSDPDASAPPLPPPAENLGNSGSGSVTPLASPRRDLLGESDTESLSDGASTVSVDGVVVEVSEPEVAVPEIRVTSQAIRDASWL